MGLCPFRRLRMHRRAHPSQGHAGDPDHRRSARRLDARRRGMRRRSGRQADDALRFVISHAKGKHYRVCALKFVSDRPFADPDTAAPKLVEIANGVEAAIVLWESTSGPTPL
jgi:hypothetical protein